MKRVTLYGKLCDSYLSSVWKRVQHAPFFKPQFILAYPTYIHDAGQRPGVAGALTERSYLDRGTSEPTVRLEGCICRS